MFILTLFSCEGKLNGSNEDATKASVEKTKASLFQAVESTQYPANKAGISAFVHNIIVDSLYFDSVESTVFKAYGLPIQVFASPC